MVPSIIDVGYDREFVHLLQQNSFCLLLYTTPQHKHVITHVCGVYVGIQATVVGGGSQHLRGNVLSVSKETEVGRGGFLTELWSHSTAMVRGGQTACVCVCV